MAKSPFQTVLFHPFMEVLKKAAANGHRIEPVDKQAWAKYIREHKIPIAGLLVYGQSMSESIRPVVIVGQGEWDGLYMYSTDDEVSARFVPPEGAAPAAPASGDTAPPAPGGEPPAEAPPAEAPPA